MSNKALLIKRTYSLVLIFMMLFMLFGFATVSAEVTTVNSKLIKENPAVFYARGFHYEEISDDIPPFHRLQNLMEFEFISGTEVQQLYTIEYSDESIYGPALHKLELNLIYNKSLLKTDSDFITGSFNYYWDRNGVINEYSGSVKGGILEVSTDIMGFFTDYDYTNAISLALAVDGDPWEWTIYLEVPGEEDYYIGSTFVDENYVNPDETTNVPAPATQADVAAGVGISTVGIALVNALTKTSVLGSTSLNMNVSAPNSAPSASAPVSQGIPSSGEGSFFSVIGDFFKNLFSNLRDMFTDEGRSYASGKVSDFLDDADFEDSSDDN